MKIGMIVFSQTGHTLMVIEQLQQRLVQAGHQAKIELISITGEANPGQFQFTSKPGTDGYDALILASPVQAFSLNPVMKTYLENLDSLKDMPVAFLVTKQLPFYWTGGNRSLATMERICRSKGAKILGSSIVIWTASKREATREAAIARLTEVFQTES